MADSMKPAPVKPSLKRVAKGKDSPDWTDLTADRWVRRGVTFEFRRINGWDANQYFEEWRESGGALLLNTDVGDLSIGSLIIGLMSLDREFVAQVRNVMFSYVDFFAPPVTKNPQPLRGAEEIAFAELSAVDVYQVFARSLAVNFTDLSPLIDRIGKLVGSLGGASPTIPT